MGDDRVLDIMTAFLYCKKQYKSEMADGMRVGLRIAYDSATKGMGFSRELYGLLNNQPYKEFSMVYLKKLLIEISDIYVNNVTFLCDNVDQSKTETRPDFINGVKIVYEVAMQGFLKIIQIHGDIEEAMTPLMIYRNALESVINGLRDTVLVVLPA